MCAVGFGAALPAAAQTAPPTAGALRLIGDMVVGPSHAPGTKASPSGFVGIDGFLARPWPGGRLPVRFGNSVSPQQQAFFFEMCGRWSAVANVRCTAASPGEDAVEVSSFGPFGGCNSTVGNPPFYPAMMNLDASCWYDSVVLHEIGHAFGLLHEHQRPDRDAFVSIDYSNVQPGYSYAFDFSLGKPSGPYDLRSIMHYQWYAFGIDAGRPVIRPRGTNAPLMYDMGAGRVSAAGSASSAFPSDGDARAMRSIYGANPAMPGAPKNLRLAGVDGNTLAIQWDPPTSVTPVQGYRIDVGTDAAFTKVAASVPVNADVTSVSGTLADGIYHLRVVPRGAAGDGVPSKTLSIQLPGGAVIAPPAAPTSWAVRSRTNPVTIAWAPGANGGAPTSYIVVAGTTPGASDLGVFDVGAATTIAGVVPIETPIFVHVIAMNAAGTAVSTPMTLDVPVDPTPAPPFLRSPVVAGRNVSLSWLPPSCGASSYTVRVRATNGGPVIAEFVTASPTFWAQDVPPGTYLVSVAANLEGYASPESNAVWVAVP